MVFIIWCYKDVLEYSITFKIHLDALLNTDVLNTHTQNLCIGYDNVPPGSIGWFDVVVVDDGGIVDVDGVWPVLLEVLVLHSVQTQVGYLHLVRTLLRCCFSIPSSFGVEQTALAYVLMY